MGTRAISTAVTAQRRRLLAVGMAAALIGGVGGIAIGAAASPNTTKTINGCVDVKTGTLTLITSKHTKCSTGQQPITWNQTGPQGPAGAKGATGPKGATGKQGPTGKSAIGFFTGGNYASSLGMPTTVASLALPAGSFIDTASVNFVNGTGSSDSVTCTVIDAGGNPIDSTATTVGASDDQVISLSGASNVPKGTAKVLCHDTANSAKASVDGADFTATETSTLPKPTAVLRTGAAGGPDVAAGDVLSSPFAPPQCTSGTTDATVSTNPAAPGPATASITSMTFSGCTFDLISISLKANNLPYSLSISGASGNAATTGPVSFTAAGGPLTCTYTSTALTGSWNNSDNGIVFGAQTLHLDIGVSSGSCPATISLSGTIGPITDTHVSGTPKVFVS